MMKNIIILLTFTILGVSTHCIAQQADASKISAIQSLLEKYEKYNQFTVDGNSIDAAYSKNFLELFETSPNQPLYNEAYGLGSQPFSFKNA